MALEKQYHPEQIEPSLQQTWQTEGIYRFDPDSDRPVYAIDTPPATVSGHLHLGHVYSYSHVDFMARYFRMNGRNVFYPMGFDDNGLPTERLVEKQRSIRAQQVGREAFIQACMETSAETEADYRALWQRLGLSIDWRYSYRTIDADSRRISQQSFLELYRKGLAYRGSAPAIWCPECQTAIAQAELSDLPRSSEFVTLPFDLPDGSVLPIATTRPELLAACVAIFVHPEDSRYGDRIGLQAGVPLYGQRVPILADPAVDPAKGTGAVMCCTFGDQADVAWYRGHRLPLIEAIDRQGCMTAVTGELAGLPIRAAREKIKQMLAGCGLILDRQPAEQSIRVHERCDTPVEYLMTRQWFIRVLENRERFLEAGEQVRWHPETMRARYLSWIEGLNWDWCISRQRTFGVPFPLWYCQDCGQVVLAEEKDLPVDPLERQPQKPCGCGGTRFLPESDVMDTWATSSLTPQIVGRRLNDPALFRQVFPFSLRPQSHEIIRTWAFYTIVRSLYHFDRLPWSDVLISGWGLAGEGMGKISKSRGGGPLPPMAMIERHSADAVRYWAASTSPGKDSIINEEKIQMGARLATKLWNVARFSQPFLNDAPACPPVDRLTPADRWILARLQTLIRRVTCAFDEYEYANAKSDIENFFWKDLADNYLELAKYRLYAADAPAHAAACASLRLVLLATLRLLAPFMPFVTEAIYRELFAAAEGETSIHRNRWPQPDRQFEDAQAEADGDLLVAIASTVRRYKSEHNLSLGSELTRVQLEQSDARLAALYTAAISDLTSVTRARSIELVDRLDESLDICVIGGTEQRVAVERAADPKS